MYPVRVNVSLFVVVAFALLAPACRAAKPPMTEPTPTARSALADEPRGVALPAPVPRTMSTRASLKLVSTWRSCHENFAVGVGDVRAEVAKLAQGCAEATKMHKVGEPFTGEQTAAAKPQTFRWKAQGGHCYRAYGVGVPSIKNLDLLLLDSAGASLGQDGTDDGAPVVLDSGAVCWKQDDDAAVVVSVGDGGGAFAVEVWGD